MVINMKKSLKRLDLKHNQIEILKESPTESLSQLYNLDLSYNKLRLFLNNMLQNISLEDSDFDSIEKFRFLYFSFHLLNRETKCVMKNF